MKRHCVVCTWIGHGPSASPINPMKLRHFFLWIYTKLCLFLLNLKIIQFVLEDQLLNTSLNNLWQTFWTYGKPQGQNIYSLLIISFMPRQPIANQSLPHCRGFTTTLNGTQKYTNFRTRLDDGCVHRRDLYLTTQHSQETDIRTPGGIRTSNPSNRAVADLSLRPRRQPDRSIN